MGTVLVTGGAGFYGVHIARALVESGESVVINYRRSFRVPRILADIIESRVKAVRCDLLDPFELLRVIRGNGVDSIVHAAIVNNYEASIYTCLQNNVQGTINVMEAAALGSVKKVTYISSISALSGAKGQEAEAEDESLPSASPGVTMIPVSKKVGEVLTSFYGATFDISVTAIRPGHSYGPYCGAELGDLRMLRNIMEGSVSGKPVHLPHVDRDTNVRMIYVRDSAQAITMVHLAPKHAQRAYCLAGKAYSWGEISDVTGELSSHSKVTFGRYVPPPEGQRLPERLPDPLTLTSEFGFRPKYELKDGLSEYIEWYRNGQP